MLNTVEEQLKPSLLKGRHRGTESLSLPTFLGFHCKRVAGHTLRGAARVCQSEALGSRPAPPEHHPRRHQSTVGTRRAASMQDTLSEGTARAAQLAPTVARLRTSHSSSERVGQPQFWCTAFPTPLSSHNSGRVFSDPKKDLWQNKKNPRCRWDRL